MAMKVSIAQHDKGIRMFFNITIDGVQYDVVIMCYTTSVVLTVEIS